MSKPTTGAHDSDTGRDETPASTRQNSPDEGSAEPRSPEEIEAHLEQTRHELGQTVEALSAKLDVKSRARHQVASAKHAAAEQLETLKLQAAEVVHHAQDAVTDEDGNLKPVVPIGAAIVVAIGIAWVLINRRRHRVLVLGVKALR